MCSNVADQQIAQALTTHLTNSNHHHAPTVTSCGIASFLAVQGSRATGVGAVQGMVSTHVFGNGIH